MLFRSSTDYTFTTTNNFGCTFDTTITVDILTGINLVTVSNTTPSCPGVCDAEATVSASGGTGNYTYTWSGGDYSSGDGSTATGLCEGSYVVTAVDNAICEYTLILSSYWWDFSNSWDNSAISIDVDGTSLGEVSMDGTSGLVNETYGITISAGSTLELVWKDPGAASTYNNDQGWTLIENSSGAILGEVNSTGTNDGGVNYSKNDV